MFDGVAALLGLCDHNHFEAQAAMALESAAAGATSFARSNWVDQPARFRITSGAATEPAEIELAPLVREILHRQEGGVRVGELAALFHEQLALAWAAAVNGAVETTGIATVALSGGVFCNQILTQRLTGLLKQHGLQVLRHRLVPPNDGGLALGQAAVAAARWHSAAHADREGK